MRSADFITEEFGNADGKEKRCSSILKDGEGNIYSYGEHYPLMFEVAGIVWRNVAGYSVSTSKHIGWCWGFDSTDVKLIGSNTSIKNIAHSLRMERSQINEDQQRRREGAAPYRNNLTRLAAIEIALDSIPKELLATTEIFLGQDD